VGDEPLESELGQAVVGCSTALAVTAGLAGAAYAGSVEVSAAGKVAIAVVTGGVAGVGWFGAAGLRRLWLRALASIVVLVLVAWFAFFLSVVFSPH
jgi:hypothetical protein